MTRPLGTHSNAALTEENRQFLQRAIYKFSGIVIESQKEYLLEARLTPIMQRRALKSLNELCKMMRKSGDPQLDVEITEAMTTHETYFFRDPGQFQLLREKLIPALLQKRQGARKLSIWSAAASRGQEAYTLAMMLAGMQIPNWSYQILGTDLSEKVLKRAREAEYTAAEAIRGLAPDQLKLYFKSCGANWKLNDAIRSMVQFKQFDLRESMRSLGTFDLVMCRNVMIYFDTPTKRQILESIASVLAPDGILFLGSTETTMGVTDCFARRTLGNAVYYTRKS